MLRNRTIYLSLLFLGTVILMGVLSAVLMADWKQCSLLDVPSLCLNLSANEAVRFIRSSGGWGVAGAIGLMVIRTFIPFPAGILPIANGMIYGTLWGAVISWIGAMLSAYLAFGLARLFGSSFVQSVLSAGQRGRLHAWSHRNAAADLFAVRLIPLISFNLINFAAGLTPVSLRTFTWTTGLGILPVMMLLVVFGDQAQAMSWWAWLFVGVAVVPLWIFVRKQIHRFS